VLDENVRIYNSLYQGYSNKKEMNPILKAILLVLALLICLIYSSFLETIYLLIIYRYLKRFLVVQN